MSRSPLAAPSAPCAMPCSPTFPSPGATLWTVALLAGDAQANDLTRFLREIAEAAVETTWRAGGTRKAVCRGRMRVRLTARQAEPAPARKST